MKKSFAIKFLLGVIMCCSVAGVAQMASIGDPLVILSKMQFRGIATLTFVDPKGQPIPEEMVAGYDADGKPIMEPYSIPIDENGNLTDNIEYIVRIGYKNLNAASIVISNLHAWVLCVNQKNKDFSVRDWSMAFNDYVRAEDNQLRPFYNKYWSGELIHDSDPAGPRESAFFRSTLPDATGAEQNVEDAAGASLELRFKLADKGDKVGETLGRLLRLSNYINGSEREHTRLTIVLVGDANALLSTPGGSYSQALPQMRLVINLERTQGGWLVLNKAFPGTLMENVNELYPIEAY